MVEWTGVPRKGALTLCLFLSSAFSVFSSFFFFLFLLHIPLTRPSLHRLAPSSTTTTAPPASSRSSPSSSSATARSASAPCQARG